MASKPGRNDPCPCGSGKKYKKCCALNNVVIDEDSLRLISDEVSKKRYRDHIESLDMDRDYIPTFMEFIGKPNPATEVSHRLNEAAKDKVFSSRQEMQDFMADFMNSENNRPRKDFLGMSSTQMRRLSQSPDLESIDDILKLSSNNISEWARTAPIVQQILFIFEKYKQFPEGLGITARGNYQRVTVKAFVEEFHSKAFLNDKTYNEGDIENLSLIHDFLISSDYVYESSTKSRLNEKGCDIAKAMDIDRLWREVFNYLLYEDDWMFSLSPFFRFDGLQRVQTSGVFMLMYLEASPFTEHNSIDLYSFYVKAFPHFDPDWDTAKLKQFYLPPVLVSRMFLDYFCKNLGLVEYSDEIEKSDRRKRGSSFIKTELFKKAFIWVHKPELSP